MSFPYKRPLNSYLRVPIAGLLLIIFAITASSQTASPANGSNSSAELAAKVMALQALLQTQSQQIATQQKQIEELRSILKASATIRSSISAAPLQHADSKATGKTGEDARLRHLEERVEAMGRVHLNGDFRFREEAFAGGLSDRSRVLNRLRYRLRLNATTQWNQDFSGGFAFATGDINDPISTNQTATEFYTRKPFNLDRAWLNYNPHQFNNLVLMFGKFAYPFYRTELTWDNDLNPEGLAQTLTFHPSSTGPLNDVTLVGFELPFSEAAGVSPNDKSVVQSAVYGGQAQTVWNLAPWLKLGAYTAYFDYHNADPIALALQTASARNPQSPLTGLLPLNGNGFVQNSMVITKATNIVTINGAAYKTGITSIVNAQFSSKFGLFDAIARLDLTTPSERWPVTLLGDLVQNTRACGNVVNIRPTPPNTATETFVQTTTAPCDPHQRLGYWLEGRIGRLQRAGDYQFAYTRMFIEREAVMSAFDQSDLRQGSNVSEHRVEALYDVQKNVELVFTGLFGHPLVNIGSPKQPILARLQLDVNYKF